MLTYSEAKKIGFDACVDKIGRDFVKQYESTSCVGYGDELEYAFCYVGVDDRPDPIDDSDDIILDDSEDSKFPYLVSCKVWYDDGRVEFIDYMLPDRIRKRMKKIR